MNDLRTSPGLSGPTSGLERLASNLRWTWDVPTRYLLDLLPGAEPHVHPLHTIASCDPQALERFGTERATEIEARVDELDALVAAAGERTIAYFSPEFGVAAEVAQYSGGLGILAGDHLKAATDASRDDRCQGWMMNRTQRSPSRSNTSRSNACSEEVRAPVSTLAFIQEVPSSVRPTHSRQPISWRAMMVSRQETR